MDAKELLAKYLDERKKLLDDLRSLNTTVSKMEATLGEVGKESEALAEFLASPTYSKSAGSTVVKATEFFGMTYGEAAKAYLEKVGEAVTIDQLVEALGQGGCKVGGANPKRVLYISLVRNVREFVPPREGYIGLRKFYPTVKQGRKRNSSTKRESKQKTVSEKAQKKESSKKQKMQKQQNRVKGNKLSPQKEKLKHEPMPAKKTASEPPTTKIVREILSDGKFHVFESILKKVQERAGKPTPGIVVKSILRKNDFEQVGTEFKLRQV